MVGSIHGNETAGRAVLRRLRRAQPAAGVELWLVNSVNPDGVRRGTRQNARGVDLNRNFARRWRGGGRAFDTYFPGRRAFSEPESQAVRRLVRRIRPAVTVYYHQHLRLGEPLRRAPTRGSCAPTRAASACPARTLPNYRGTATSWQNHTFPGTSAFVVELPAGPLSPASARRHADAVLAAGRAPGGRRRRFPPADRLAQDPLRRHPPRPDARVRAPPLRPRHAPRCATRR